MFQNTSLKNQIFNKSVKVDDKELYQDFVDAFFSYLPIDQDNQQNIEELSLIAKQTYEHFQTREMNGCKISILPIQDAKDPHNVLLISNDDMPFIVDSLNEVLFKKKYTVQNILNSLLHVERDGQGKAIKIKHEKSLKPNESIIYAKITPIKSKDSLKKLASEIRSVMKSVRLAVTDWQAMLQKTEDVKSVFNSNSHEDQEKNSFLKWIKEDNYTFLGYEKYIFEKKSKAKEPKITPCESLGVVKNVDSNFHDNLIEDIFYSDKRILRGENLTIGKVREVSKVHRYSSYDYICVIERKDGEIISANVFLGLFVTRLDYQSVTTIPLVRDKVNDVVDRAGFNKSSFNGKELFSIVETLPRDELLQLSVDELYLTAMMILSSINNPKLILFVRENRCKVFLNFLVFFPKSRVTSDIVDKITNVVKKFVPGKFISSYLRVTGMNLSYVQVSMKVDDNEAIETNIHDFEIALDEATSLWSEKFVHYIEEKLRSDSGVQISREYSKVFPQQYQNLFDFNEAIEDINSFEQLSVDNQLIFRLCNRENDSRGCLNLKAYSLTTKVDLYKIMPILENLGFNAIEERVFKINKKISGRDAYIQDFILDVCKRDCELEEVKDNLEDAILRVYQGDLKNDIINSLILNADLDWRSVYLLSAYCKYLLQIKVPHSQEFIKQTLVKHPKFTRKIVQYFYKKFEKKISHAELNKVRKELDKDLQSILDNIEDKVFKKVLDVIDNTLRTNFFQENENGSLKNYISFKFDSGKIADIPLPAPFVEIFVYSSEMEGIHLRGGKVSRGGLRWSDHDEDYRNEVLGLMKAQMTKNAVIVPDGSKGGFVVKNSSQFHSRDEFFAAGVKCYKTFLSGLLDITDNIIDGNIISPKEVVCYDDRDPYLVVAADKGTATFSDIANEVAESYNFWLGDAFASGGSAGYDHKKMGITARGAWVSVEEHFKAIGKDISKDEFTVIGIGDMSGDVFGNGMLLSKNIRLIAAFNHLHIFIDPNPDSKKSFKERQRLFKLPRSQWTDYDKSLISKGGGVFERSAKKIEISEEIKEALDIDCNSLDPEELIKYILRANVDLLWNGGIGTYVKSTNESNSEVGDKPNDNLRVNGDELRCKIVGEGGNLGLTQLGRVEYALNGGCINTDFIDNSAGVDCSDHEVNIKIALQAAVSSGKISLKQRNKLLDAMEKDVAKLVLEDNLSQHIAISISHQASIKLFETKIKLIEQLKGSVGLRPEIEYLPGLAETNRRSQEKVGFTRPEISVLTSYSKMAVYKNLISSKLSQDKYFEKYLLNYFPEIMRSKFLDEISKHQLRREIIVTGVSNKMVNHIGTYFFHDAQDYSGLKGCDIARAFHIVWEIFDGEYIWSQVDTIKDYKDKLRVYFDIRTFLQTAIFWFLRNVKQPLNIEKAIKKYKVGVNSLSKEICDYIIGSEHEKYSEKYKHYSEIGLSDELTHRMSILETLYASMDIIDISEECSLPIKKVAYIYFKIGQEFHFDWLASQADIMSENSYWKRMLVKTIKDDIFDQRRALTSIIIKKTPEVTIQKKVEHWCSLNNAKIMIYNRFIDSIKCMDDIDAAKLVVAVKQGEVLIKK